MTTRRAQESNPLRRGETSIISDELLEELHRLSRTEKLRVIRLLADDLAQEEGLLIPGAEYPIYTPLGNEAAAQTLMKMLEDDKKTRDA